MKIVVADTGPLNYLVMIGHVDLLPALFEKVLVPAAVWIELTSGKAPIPVQLWISSHPDWLDVHDHPVSPNDEDFMKGLDTGEKEAIHLAISLHADLLLIDDRKGVRAAQSKGLRVTGTLGLLDLAADRGLLDFAHAIQQLEQTNFRKPVEILEALLAKHQERHS